MFKRSCHTSDTRSMPDSDQRTPQQQTREVIFFNSRFRASQFNINKKSNQMQQNVDIYSLQSHYTCFGCHSTHHQEY